MVDSSAPPRAAPPQAHQGGDGGLAPAPSPPPEHAAAPPPSGLATQLTAILTTSPSPVMPSTELILAVLRSFAAHAPELCACRLLIVCDGIKPSPKTHFRAGRVDAHASAAYEEYKRRLARLAADAACCCFPRAELLELHEHHGFGFAVLQALRRVSTPLVCVIQHDRVLLRSVELGKVCHHLLHQEGGSVGYVLLPIRATADYPMRMRAKLGERGIRPPASDIQPHAIALCPRVRLLPCLAWYDSTHICLTHYYINFIFGGCLDRTAAFRSPTRIVTKGAFLEAELAPQQMQDVQTMGLPAYIRRWQTFLYDDGDAQPAVGHLNGAQTLSWHSLQQRFGDRADVGQRWQRSCTAEGTRPRDLSGAWQALVTSTSNFAFPRALATK
ncbi:hypothetical protein AB1Y20_010754 [Prymnesium parvum]|uniref:Uncharacterized protein n=1 Tax=Prymnesium parvum TaxID=97485 RepID=A0AB34IRW4_PRYPA